MRWAITAAVLAAGLGCAGGASAEVFKCSNGGVVTYQQSPCMPGGAETRMSPGTEKLLAWEGCYATRARRWKGNATRAFLEVRRSPEGVVLVINDQKQPFPMRAVTQVEMRWLQAMVPLPVHEGIGVRWSPREQEVAERKEYPPMGIYRAQDERGQPVLVALVPFLTGEVEKVPCFR